MSANILPVEHVVLGESDETMSPTTAEHLPFILTAPITIIPYANIDAPKGRQHHVSAETATSGSTRGENNLECTLVAAAETPEAVEQDYRDSHPEKKKRKEGPQRPLGRPKGSGPKQRAVQENKRSTLTLPKRPVGRPRKVMMHGSGTSTRAISGLHVPRTPAFGPSQCDRSLESQGQSSISSLPSPAASDRTPDVPLRSPWSTALGTPCLSTVPTVPDSEREIRVILDEDLARDIVWSEDEDEDDEPEVSGEGVGEEGGFNMGEEGENEEDPELGDEGMSHAKATQRG